MPSAQRKSLNSFSLASFLASASVFALCVGLAPRQAHAIPACGVAIPNGSGGTDYVVGGSVLNTCAISNNDTLTVTNSGAVIVGGAGGNAVEASGTPTSILNHGLISASEMFKAAIDNSGVLGSLVNTGTIQGVSGTTAVENSGTIGLLNNNGGLITSGGSAIHNTGTMTITNNGGVIESTNFSNAIYSSPSGALYLDNTSGLITTQVQYDTVRITGSGSTINNTNGTIQAQTGSAVALSGPLGGPLINTGGLLASASDDDSEGTLDFRDDMGNLTVVGGTIINTDNTSNDRVAVSVNDDQTGVITFDGVTILADGTGVAQGYAIYIYEYDASINLTASTYVRGQIYVYCCGFMHLTTSGTVIGDITGESDDDTVTVTGGSITGNVFLNEGNDTLTLNAGTVNGNVDMGDGDDTATINGGTLNGNLDLEGGHIGFAGFSIFNAANNDTVTLNGGTVNGNIELGNGDDTFTYNGGILNGNVNFGSGVNTFNVNAIFATDGRQFITDAFEATNLHVGSSGDFTVNDTLDLQLGSIYVADGGRLYVAGANLTGLGALVNAGTIQIGVGRSLSAGVLDNTVAGRLIFDTAGVANIMRTGAIHLGESAGDLSMQTVGVNFTGGTIVMPTRSLIVSSTGPVILPSAAVADNSFLYDFGLEVDELSPNDIYLTLTRAMTIEEASTSPNNAAVGKVILNDLAGSTDPVINQIQANLNHASSQAEFNEILEATTPTVDSGNQVAAVGMTGAMFDLADGQLAMVNTGDSSGVAGGNALTGLHFWGQGFGAKADQGFRGGIDGYDAQVRGVALGVDTRDLRKDTVVGLSLGFANTDVGSHNANRTSTDVDSYQLMAYGNQELGGDIFLTGMAVAGWNRNDQTRHDVGGIAGLDAEAEYDSWVGGLRSSIGRNFRYGPDFLGARSFLLSPQLFSEYVHFSRDGYAETGAGGADLTTGDGTQDILNFGVSLQAEWTFVTQDGGRVMPDLHAAYKYDAIGDQTDTTASFAAGGATFSSQGVDPARSTFVLGAGLKVFDTSGWDFTTNYDYSFKDDYKAHSGFLRAAYAF